MVEQSQSSAELLFMADMQAKADLCLEKHRSNAIREFTLVMLTVYDD